VESASIFGLVLGTLIWEKEGGFTLFSETQVAFPSPTSLQTGEGNINAMNFAAMSLTSSNCAIWAFGRYLGTPSVAGGEITYEVVDGITCGKIDFTRAGFTAAANELFNPSRIGGNWTNWQFTQRITTPTQTKYEIRHLAAKSDQFFYFAVYDTNTGAAVDASAVSFVFQGITLIF
jgi:hypothetical protein